MRFRSSATCDAQGPALHTVADRLSNQSRITVRSTPRATEEVPDASAAPFVAPPLSGRERDALVRGKGGWLPLVLVVFSLAVAILLPRLTQRHIARLRDDINNVADPARLRITEIELDLALEGSQRRGFLLTGDESLEKQFELTRQHRRAAEHDLTLLAHRLDGTGSAGLSRYVETLSNRDSGLDALVATNGNSSAAALDEQRARFVAVQGLFDTLARKIDSVGAVRRSAIAETESGVAMATAALVLLGIGAALLVARLGARFRRMALRLDEQEARFRQIAENLTAVVWLSDPEFQHHLYVNGAYERIWGRSRASLERDPRSFMEGVHPEDRDRVRAALADVAHHVADLEFRVVQPEGTVRWVWGRGFPVRDPGGKIFRTAGIVEDMTERHAYALEREHLLDDERQARELAERRRAELEIVTESRARLVRGFTHDVKNPLGAADGFLALLEEGVLGDVSETQRGTVAKVRRAIRHALELIAQLLDIARAEAGQLELHRQKVDVGEHVWEIAEAFSAQAKAKRLDIDVVLEHDIPAIETDPSRLRQVIGNLVSNAVKYTPAGGHINIRTSDGDGRTVTTQRVREVVISVADDGPGISADKLPTLFTEFTRFDPGAAEGAGIGLAISQKIAQALGGEITVESERNKGSTFALHLPT